MNFSFTIGKREFNFGTKSVAADFLAGRDSDDSGGGAQLTSAYQQSTWVYACIVALAEQVAQIPLRISRGQRVGMKARDVRWRKRAAGEELVEDGALVELLNRPHPQMTRVEFWQMVLSWLMLRGESFIIPTTLDGAVVGLDERAAGKLIKRLVIVPPDQMRDDVRANVLAGWHFYGGTRDPLDSVTLLPNELLLAKLINPFDFWRGMSPLSVARLAAQTDYASAQFMKGLMTNNADTGVIVRTEQQLDESQREQMLAALKERKRKAGTADRPMLLWGGAEVVKPTLSSADMQFLESRKYSRGEICSVFRVPEEIVSSTDTAKYDVMDGARLNFIENRVSPLCELLEAVIEPLARAFDKNFYVWFDVDSLPIMQRARRERFVTAAGAFNIGVPIDDCSSIFDLGLPDDLIHKGKSFLPFSLQEIGVRTETPPPPPFDVPATDSFSRMASLLEKMSQPRQLPAPAPHVCAGNPEYEAAMAASIKIKKGKVSKFFFEQRGRVLAKLSEKTKGIADDLFNLADETEKLLAKLKPLLLTDYQFGGAQLAQEVGIADLKLPPTDALAFLAKRTSTIKDINATTFQKLKDSLADGLNAGESYNELADRVKSVYGTSDERAATIALTETNVAINSGRDKAMRLAKVERKGWQTSRLETTRQSHLANESHSKANNGIGIDEVWPNGCSFPGDPGGEPGETINCRCFGYAVLAKSAREDSRPTKFLQFAEFNVRGES